MPQKIGITTIDYGILVLYYIVSYEYRGVDGPSGAQGYVHCTYHVQILHIKILYTENLLNVSEIQKF